MSSPPPLAHLKKHAVVGSTVALSIKRLPPGWEQAEWYKQLTVVPLVSSVAPCAPPPIHTAFVRKGWLHLPRFYGTTLVGGDIADDRRKPGVPMSDSLKFTGKLREEPPQVEATRCVMTSLRTTGGAMLVLPCGFGKTVCSIWVMTQLRRRTLVLVHTGVLADQWESRLRSFCSGVRVGRLQQDTVQIDGYDIVVGMIQSVMKRDYDKTLMATFGTVVIDEAHHIAAPLFSGALQKLHARYVLGLSATPDRKDGLGKILPWMMGPIAYRAQRSEDEDVGVELVTYDEPKAQVELLDFRKNPKYAQMLTNVALNEVRNTHIMRRIVGLVRGTARAVVVLSERRLQLETLEAMLLQHPDAVSVSERPDYKRKRGQDPPLPPVPQSEHVIRVARVLGGTPADIRAHGFEHANVLLSTYMYASEGMDIPRLDTLVMASPGVNIEQTIGRILRTHPGKQTPLVVDVKDPFSVFGGMGWKRLNYYNSQNYDVTHHTWSVGGTVCV